MRNEPLLSCRNGPEAPSVPPEALPLDAEVPHRLSVVFVPYWGAGNPYQDALIQRLSALLVEVKKNQSLKGLFRYGVLLNGRPDIVHLHWLPMFGWREWRCLRCLAFVGRLLLLRVHGIPLIWTIHNLLPHESHYPRIDWLLARVAAGLSSGLIVHGCSARRQAVDHLRLPHERRFAVIPHGNYLDSYPDRITRAAARRKLALDDARLVFLFLGAVRPYKGILELLAAFRLQRPEEAVLVIAGEPLDAGFCRKIEEAVAETDNIRFCPGFVPNAEIQVYMNASDVVVLPYRRVLSSGAALLAMSFGKPCVAPATGCLADVLDSSGAFLYDPRVETGLTESLRQAVEAREMLPSMGGHNRRKASEWTWEHAAQATRALYDRCLSDGPTTGQNR